MSSEEFRLDRTPLSRTELDEACLVAVRGFYTDPFFRYLAPRPTLRSRGLFYFFRTAVRHVGPGGVVTTVRNADNVIVGVSVWIQPGGYPQSIPTQLASIPGTIRALYRRPAALAAGGKYLEAIAKAHPKEPHWYLYLLVADPETQRRGIGAMLLNDKLGQIDSDHVGSYLETQKTDNIAYYRRFGFDLVKEVAPVTDGPPVYTMWRPPS
jgi:ribosomal protein S18 acetylase RimI-like enzyme